MLAVTRKVYRTAPAHSHVPNTGVLYMLDLSTGAIDSLPEVNSPDVESYHSWSGNSRWFVFSSRRDDGLFDFSAKVRLL